MGISQIPISRCLLAAVLLFVSICDLRAQEDSTNIWVITNKFLVENGERNPKANPYPIIKKDGMIFSYSIFTKEGEIIDPNFVMPYSEELKKYSFGIRAPHQPMHLLFFKERRWFVIDMKQTLFEMMKQCEDNCRKFSLTKEETLFVFNDVLRQFEIEDKSWRGSDIQPE